MDKKVTEYEYKAIVWLAACVFIRPGFVAKVHNLGAGALARDCPLGNDLTIEQEAAFDVATGGRGPWRP